MPSRLLVTRPEPVGERTAALLRGRGHDVLVAPLLRMQPIAASLGAKPWAGVLLTSANAVRALTTGQRWALRTRPVVAVGDRTAEAARAAGFADVRSANGDAADLVHIAATVFASAAAPLLYLAGEDRARDLETLLAARGITVETAVVYCLIKAIEFPRTVREALAARRIDGVLHYSRRSAETYIACAEASGLKDAALVPVHYSLSREIAVCLSAAGAQAVRISPHPSEAALLSLLATE